MRRLLAALGACLLFIAPAAAGERQKIGFGLLMTNDVIGDTHDRWRSGSVASSHVWAPGWSANLPRRFGELIELRINGEVMGPENLARPAPLDRRYAQALSFGLHTHFKPGTVDFAIGADLVLTGPMTQIDHVQSTLHEVTGGGDPSAATRSAQVGNDVNPTLVLEAGREFRLSGSARLRPFVEARAGVETLLRVGADLTLGRFGESGLNIRAPVSGHRFSAVRGVPHPGLSLVMGADVAHVADSEFLSSTGPVRLRDTRSRVRAGLHWRGRRGNSLFYGLTWLDKEFTTQHKPQVVGSVKIHLKF